MKQQRAAWRQRAAAVDPARHVFVDEAGTVTAMDRTYGRAPSGVRVDGPVPRGRWKVFTPTVAVRVGGVPESACPAFDGATDTACFGTYVEPCSVPTLRAGDVAVMDSLSCHKTAEVERPIRSAGAEAWFLPPYSPGLDTIEAPFGKLQEALRSAAARTAETLIDADGAALRSVTPADIRGWFAHSGYGPAGSSGRDKGKPL